METISFGKRTSVIIFLILVVVIFIIILASWKNSGKNDSEENRLTRLLKRWRELTDEIEEELTALKLTQEMKIVVKKKIAELLNMAKVIFAVAFVMVAAGFYWQSQEIVSSITNTVALFIFVCCTCTFFLANRFAESNSIIKSVSIGIRKWVYKR